jgi:hypothetical protein
MRIFFWLTPLLAVLAAAPAIAQGTAEQRTACEADAYRLCDAYVPDAILIERCLKANGNALSAPCRAEFGFPSASADSGKKRKR